ncbi:MAG: universal stress protein [Isosphaeraceae bacterium]|nr:universal stress protein [Isosphaeraceae bacterium]
MKPIRKILVPLLGEADPADLLRHAARVAARNQAAVELVSVIEPLAWYARLVLPSAQELDAIIVRDRTRLLDEQAAKLREQGIETSTVLARGRAHVEICRIVKEHGHDLLMKQAEPNGDVPFGSTDMHLLRGCACPVWLIEPGRGDRPFLEVVAAVDPAPSPEEGDVLHLHGDVATKDARLDVRILELALTLAKREGGSVDIVHAWTAPGEALVRAEAMLSPEQVDLYAQDVEAAARHALDRLLHEVPTEGVPAVAHLIKGDPADVIADFTSKHEADILVMGTVARSGVVGLLMGNTAEETFPRVGCSVIAVKPESRG